MHTERLVPSRPVRAALVLSILGSLSAPALGAQEAIPAQPFPNLLGGGFSTGAASAFFGTGVREGLYNPALGADRELSAVEAALGGVVPLSAAGRSAGRAFVGWSSPLSFGVLSLAGAASLSALELGPYAGPPTPTGAAFSALLSKRAADNLALGVGLSWSWWRGDQTASGFDGSVGALLSLPDLAAGAEVSFVLGGIGAELSPWSDYDPYLSLTPAVAARVAFVDDPSFGFALTAAAAAPLFDDLDFAAGTELRLGRSLFLDLSWRASLVSLWDGWMGASTEPYPEFSLVPELRLGFDASSLLSLGDYRASFYAAGGGASSGVDASVGAVFAKGSRDISPPELAIGPLPAAVSPALQGSLDVPLSARDDSPIISWSLGVYAQDGTAVYTVADPPGGGSGDGDRGGVLSRLFSVVKRRTPPSALSVPLAALGPDGRYSMLLRARDSRGNEGRSSVVVFDLDSVAPNGRADLPSYRIFSPNGDGQRDLLPVAQSGSAEAAWTGRFVGADGKTVRSYRWFDGPPPAFSWDGRDEEGAVVPDGVYSYELEAQDGAGNHYSTALRGIVVDGRPSSVALSVSPEAIASASQELGPGVKNSVAITLAAPRRDGLVDWRVEVVSPSGKPFLVYRGATENLDRFSDTLVFDGRNAEGDPAADGIYRVRALLRYTNGDEARSADATFRIDSRQPSGRIRSSQNSFDVDDPVKMLLSYDLSEGAAWTVELVDEAGAPVVSFPLGDGGEGERPWLPSAAEGAPLGVGAYTLVARGVSATGVVGTTPELRLRAYSGGAVASISAMRDSFSPFVGGDAGVRFLLRADARRRVLGWSVAVSAPSGVVRTLGGVGFPPASLVWDGRDDGGAQVADGSYGAILSVRYEDGGSASSAPARTILDTAAPSASVRVAGTIFSPNGDSHLDTISIAQRGDEELEWVGRVVAAGGSVVRSFRWKGTPVATVVWDGKDDGGTAVPDGAYRYILSSQDAAGNEALAESDSFLLDARRPKLAASVDKVAFSPNGDGFADRATFAFAASLRDGVSSWTFSVLDGAGHAVRSAKGSDALPASFVWDGADDAGKTVPDASYVGTLRVSYDKGDIVEASSPALLLDRTPPVLALEAGPLPFSPDGDGQADELSFRFGVSDASALAGWRLTINDPEGYPFRSFSGNAAPPDSLGWDGTSLDGELVQAAQEYPWELIVRDALGNVATRRGVIPVDVFVLRDGDRLKIRISSITFAPNAASLVLSDQEKTDRNDAILRRIADVLSRFPAYRVRIEGHAVNLSGTEREERSELEPLSLARAKAVKDALVALGVDAARLDVVGLGGREPLVPHGDVRNRWKNRRVEFVLIK